MAALLCVYAFEDDDGRERTWDVYGSYTPPRPPPPINPRRYDETLSDPGDPEEIEIEYAEEGKHRVDAAELDRHEEKIRDQVSNDPPEMPRGRGRRWRDYEED